MRSGLHGYFHFLRERYRILLRRRAGDPAPWTSDPVLQAWRFCNVRREDDKVTTWFRENIRDPLAEDPKVFFATIAFRWFNTIETGQLLKPYLLSGEWPREEVERELKRRKDAGKTIFTAAFMINSAPGIEKHVNILDILDGVREDFPTRLLLPRSKQDMFEYVLTIPRLGNFAAYQVVVDLQYTYLLRGAPDLNEFTVAGPGCAKGIGLCFFENADHFNYGNKGDQEAMLDLMRSALAESRNPSQWPEEWPPFVLSDIENGFCEYLKWRRGHAGFRLKRTYQGS